MEKKTDRHLDDKFVVGGGNYIIVHNNIFKFEVHIKLQMFLFFNSYKVVYFLQLC